MTSELKPPIQIAIAGTTQHTVKCAQTLLSNTRFEIPWVLTPTPKPIGRKQLLTQNPMHQFAEKHSIPAVLVEKKIDQQIKAQIETFYSKPDFLLVVDFGYLIPPWLLELPQIAPLNIHPSELPKYRGSSPGQFTLLFGEKDSAVTLMKMDESMDTGNLIEQIRFSVENTWTAEEYYQFAFEQITPELPNFIYQYASLSDIERVKHEKIQPVASPTPIARRLTREDGYVSWALLNQMMQGMETNSNNLEEPNLTSPLLNEVFGKIQSWPEVIENAVKALFPWPGVWTVVPTRKGGRRMKILSVEVRQAQLKIEQIQLEGLQPTTFDQIKNQII